MVNDRSIKIELDKEIKIGMSSGIECERDIPVIDLSDFELRKNEIRESIWNASKEIGFFQLENHGIPIEDIQHTFINAERFFSLPDKEKAKYRLEANAGWESMAQVRPSTGQADRKESYQITRPLMQGKWPKEGLLPGFKDQLLSFERSCWNLGMRVLSCFSDSMGFPSEFFALAHDPNKESYRCTLRLLHYFPTSGETNGWRAGPHTDFDCLTLLFQREGESGLQVCPGHSYETGEWVPIPAMSGRVTCNIGDMLMRWSDDRLLSNFHRVKAPEGSAAPDRYSLAFFCQANSDVVISSPSGKYEPITAGEYVAKRMQANFSSTPAAPIWGETAPYR
jgi:isopenicillin N synthase-like dioxygenase